MEQRVSPFLFTFRIVWKRIYQLAARIDAQWRRNFGRPWKSPRGYGLKRDWNRARLRRSVPGR
jgi:hypothetical protein